MNNRRAIYDIMLKDHFSRPLGRMNTRMNTFEGRMAKVQTGVGRFAGALGVTGIAAGGASIALALLAKNVVSLGVKMEQTRIAFEVMLGSKEASSAMIERLQNFANLTPFTTQQTVEGARKLLAYNIEAGKILPTLESLGNIAAAVGKEKLPLLILAFGQVKTATRLKGTELRQFTEAGVPLLALLAKELNVTAKVAQGMVTAGDISFEMVQKAIKSASDEGGKFHGLMKKLSKSVGGLWSTLVGKVSLLGTAMGEETLPVFQKILTKLIEIVDVIPRLNFDSLRESVGNMLAPLGELYGAFYDIFNVMNAGQSELQQIQGFMEVTAKWITWMTTPMRVLYTAITSVVTAVGGLANVLWQLSKGRFSAAAAISVQSTDKIIDLWKDQGSVVASIFGKGNGLKDKKGIAPYDFEKGKKTPGGEGGESTVATGLAGSKPKTVILNIDKLIENVNFTQLRESRASLQAEVQRALLVALNDTVIAVN